MTAVAATGRARLDIGRVFDDTFFVLKRKWLPFGAALLILLVPGAANNIIQMGRLQTLAASRANPAAFNPAAFADFRSFGLLFIYGLIVGPVVLGLILHGTVQDLDKSPSNLGVSLRVGLRNWLGMVALTILWVLGEALGTMLLIIPGIMLMAAWAAAYPAKIAEGLGPIQALGRSLELTRGRRWSIFLLGLILVISIWIFEIVVVLTGGAISAGVALSGGTHTFAQGPVFVILGVVGVVVNLFLLVLNGALYHQLRQLRDGPSVQVLGEVFA